MIPNDKSQIIVLLRKLKYRLPLSPIERIEVHKKGLVDINRRGMVLSPKGAHYIEVFENKYGKITR